MIAKSPVLLSFSSIVRVQGYTIPLDKRLASDGRGLQDHTINDNFAKLAQALYTADREVSVYIHVGLHACIH